jgi:hypothetical protein
MNQHLLVKMRQFGVANLGNSLAKAGPMSGAQPMSKANAWLQRLLWVLPAIGALNWCIFPAQLNDPELIRGSLTQ